MDIKNKYQISEEMLARFLDGNVSKSEVEKILTSAQKVPELSECLDILTDIAPRQVSFTYRPHFLPIWRLAAANDHNTCSIRCEIYILKKHQTSFNAWTLLRQAKLNNWLQREGTPLHNVGRILEVMGFKVTRKYDSTPEDLTPLLLAKYDIIAVVDKNILNDGTMGEKPEYHAVIIEGLDSEIIRYIDPDCNDFCQISVGCFVDAWAATRFYMVYGAPDRQYNPQPLEFGDINLPHGLESLTEAIAENVHDVWARARMDEGWTYGEHRDDINKKHPDLTDYSSLPQSEKNYDSILARNTLKMVLSMGFGIIDCREDSACPKCGTMNSPDCKFCPSCGKRLKD